MEIKILNKENIYDFSESSIREDLDRIKKVCKKLNVFLSDDEAYLAYHNWSEDFFCAGWLLLPDSDLDLYELMRESVLPYFFERYLKVYF